MSNRPSKKARRRERRAAHRHGLTILELREARENPNAGRGRRRRTQGADHE